MNRLILALATILTSSIASGFRAQNNGVPVRGLYCNYDYAYSVVVPQGITAFRDPPPLPNHGIGIDISKSQQSYIWVDASYNAAEWSSFADAVSDNLGYLKNDGAAS